jgi:cytochrome c553
MKTKKSLPRSFWTMTGAAAALGIFSAVLAAQGIPGAPPQNAPPPPGLILPLWAYPINAPNPTGRGAGPGPGRAPDDGAPLHVPGSDIALTRMQVRSNGMFGLPDWFPNDHPPMPDIVGQGNPSTKVYACGYCHLPNGQGRPENQSVAGLPAGYILQQLADFKSGLRKGSDPRMGFTYMTWIASNVSDDEAKAAANYFASIKLKPWIKVVETDTVPVTRPSGFMLVRSSDGGTEPIGHRVIDLADDQDRFELRDASSGFTAYVPKGSIKRGEVLVMTGGDGKTIRCTICHGPDLHGLGNVPSISGRDPSQMARQIIDIRTGARNGPYTQLMKEPVRQLTDDDVVDIVAYLASLQP